MNKKVVGEVISISTYFEGKFVVEDVETGEDLTCMLAYSEDWDKLYDYLGSKRIHMTIIDQGYLKGKKINIVAIR